jgi:hypothetical protein
MSGEYDDIIDAQQGIFGADCGGLCPDVYDNRSKVQVFPGKDGVTFVFSCPRCHLTKQIVVEYPELLAIQFMMSPHIAYNGVGVLQVPVEWSFDQEHKAWYPNVLCSSGTCGQPIPILITTQEANKLTQAAGANGWFPQKKQLENHLQMVRQQYRG